MDRHSLWEADQHQSKDDAIPPIDALSVALDRPKRDSERSFSRWHESAAIECRSIDAHAVAGVRLSEDRMRLGVGMPAACGHLRTQPRPHRLEIRIEATHALELPTRDHFVAGIQMVDARDHLQGDR